MKIIVPVSGGKDSTATLLLALEEYPKQSVIPLFNDTTWEHPKNYEYLEYLEKELSIKIERTVGFKEIQSMPDLIRKYGRFPFGLGRFCTERFKIGATRFWMRENILPTGKQHQIWYGMRMDESAQRKKKYGLFTNTETHDLNDLFPNRYSQAIRKIVKARLPIIDWCTEDSFDKIASCGLSPNPLYSEGTNDRVGCYPCFLAGKGTQEKMLATEFGQQQLAIIKQLERDLGEKYKMYDTGQDGCSLCKI